MSSLCHLTEIGFFDKNALCLHSFCIKLAGAAVCTRKTVRSKMQMPIELNELYLLLTYFSQERCIFAMT